MAISNKERVGRALDLLRDGLYPFIEREMKSLWGDRWVGYASSSLPDNYVARKKSTAQIQPILKEDVSALLIVMCARWEDVFKQTLGRTERSLISELRDTRNDWAHSSTFTTDDAYRALDSITRLLTAISAPEAEAVEKQRYEILRIRFDEQARRETRRVATTPVEGTPSAGLKSWRDIVTPHEDVASGRYQQAEFAADLWQVFLDQGSDEYRLPTEFFQRTFLTDGLKHLLTNALLRLSGKGGDPVIELQTNFGGGKTHAMLALYHLCFGVAAKDLPGLESVFAAAGIAESPQNINTVVIVGNKISPGQPHKKPDGTVVHTLWGEIAWQLGKKEGYDMVRQADETATNPGDVLKELFNRYAPCLILVDEWVAYARQLHGEKDLPAGTFDTHITFAQTLSESAKNADRTLLVVSIPASEIEKGGERGHEATERIKNAIGRVESPWRPASAEESFEIVRRRLFQPLEPDAYISRDAIVRSFFEMYQQQAQEFPSECREASYKRRLEEAYPIHPELFDRLYSDWSSLDKFQRTRGVLRLMAKVIHTLWERGDKNLLIMPSSIAMDDGQVQSELTRYLDDNWVPILEKDVDGSKSLPVSLDSQHPTLGRYSACRRVARTIYLGSAPTLRAANRGLEDRRIKLGCVQPGESVATFGDALRRLSDHATYLYIDASNRYWIATQPNVTRTARDRANQIQEDKERVWQEIIQRLKQDKQRGEFAGIHIAPHSSADIPDESSMGVRLVILSPQSPHISKTENSPAREMATEILHKRGASPRYFKNLLLFLCADKSKLAPLEQAIADYLAWDSIVKDKENLNLDVSQSNQAQTKRDQANKEIDTNLNETYQWLFSPQQPHPQSPIEWTELRIQGTDSPILKASRKLIHEEHLIVNYAANRLRMEALDRYLWTNPEQGNHIDLKHLWDYLAQYLYLPRLKGESVLLEAIQSGVDTPSWTENFAYATGWDENKQNYLGLKTGEKITPTLSQHSLLVKPGIAQAQIEAATSKTQIPPISSSAPKVSTGSTAFGVGTSVEGKEAPIAVVEKPILQRFHGSVDLDALRINRDASAIADEVIQHLTRLTGAHVKITLEIEATLPDGAPDDVVHTVSENCRALKFINHAFEVE
jgi:predicted AAA+ superfamily ATPase